MALTITALNPQALLDAIYEEIDNGNIMTWSYDEDGDFYHVTPDHQWEGEAWLHPTAENVMLTLNVLPPKGRQVSSVAYAVYHGRFIEMLLAHFDTDFSTTIATAQATLSDTVGP